MAPYSHGVGGRVDDSVDPLVDCQDSGLDPRSTQLDVAKPNGFQTHDDKETPAFRGTLQEVPAG